MSPRDTSENNKDRAKGVPGRGEEDNVTYVNFGKRRRVESAEETLPENRTSDQPDTKSEKSSSVTPSSDEQVPFEQLRESIEHAAVEHHNRQQPRWSKRITSDKPRDSIFNPAAERIMKFVTTTTDSGRLARGRQYARSGNVVDLDMRIGAVHGQVAGSQNQPFSVLMQLPYRDKDDIEQLTGMLARSANSIRSALRGDLPSEVLDLLLAPHADDVRFQCDCPDHGHVCKHIVAVADRLAARVDADPLQLFNLRGINIQALETMVMEAAQRVASESAAEPAEDDSADMPVGVSSESGDSGNTDVRIASSASSKARSVNNDLFWNGRDMPDMPDPKVAPALDDSDPDLLRKAMRAVSHTNVDLLRAVSDIEDLYHFMTDRNS